MGTLVHHIQFSDLIVKVILSDIWIALVILSEVDGELSRRASSLLERELIILLLRLFVTFVPLFHQLLIEGESLLLGSCSMTIPA